MWRQVDPQVLLSFCTSCCDAKIGSSSVSFVGAGTEIIPAKVYP